MTVKIKCPKGHLNEINVEELIRKNTVPVIKMADRTLPDCIPDTLVTNCRECGAQIVLRKSQIQKFLEE